MDSLDSYIRFQLRLMQFCKREKKVISGRKNELSSQILSMTQTQRKIAYFDDGDQ